MSAPWSVTMPYKSSLNYSYVLVSFIISLQLHIAKLIKSTRVLSESSNSSDPRTSFIIGAILDVKSFVTKFASLLI
jgi:hypothetical protein